MDGNLKAQEVILKHKIEKEIALQVESHKTLEAQLKKKQKKSKNNKDKELNIKNKLERLAKSNENI